MPRLKGLSCSVQWADTGAAFQEYGTVYGDGLVESFIVVPNKPQTFTIHVRSLEHIYDGLAVVVFIDGRYQANRNQVNLKQSRRTPSVHQTTVDFLLRQRENPVGEGTYMGREWRFDSHNIVENLPPGVKESHFNLLGSIEVFVLRCHARITEQADDSGSSSAADSDFFVEEGETHNIIENDKTEADSSNTNEGQEELGQLEIPGSFLFGADGSAEYSNYYKPDGIDRRSHYRTRRHPLQPSNATRIDHSQIQHPTRRPLQQQRQNGLYMQQTEDDRPYNHPHRKRVHFDLSPQDSSLQMPDTLRPPSYERLRPPTCLPSYQNQHPTSPFNQQINHNVLPHNSFSNGLNRQYDNPGCIQNQPYYLIPSHHNVTPAYLPPHHNDLSYLAHNQFHHPQNPPAIPFHQVQPLCGTSWAEPIPHLVFDPFRHRQGAAWPPQHSSNVLNHTPPVIGNTHSSLDGNLSHLNPNGSSINALKPDRDAAANYEVHNNGVDDDVNSAPSKWEIGANAVDTNNLKGVVQGNDDEQDDWVHNEVDQSGDAGWQNEETEDNNNDNTNWETPGADSTWKEGQNDQNSTNGGNWEEKDKPASFGDSNGRPIGIIGAVSSERALFGPHGQYYTYKPRGPDEPTPDVEEEPRYDVPRTIVDATGSTMQVLPGSGYMYWKKRCVPQYIDTMQKPYAHFVFKYRTKDQLEREAGIKVDVEPTGDEAVQELQNLDRQTLIEMLVRAKTALGGKVPSPPFESTFLRRGNTAPVPVDPPEQAFLKYKLPEPRRTTGSNGGDGENRIASGGGSGNGNGGDVRDTGWDTSWETTAGVDNANSNWRSSEMFHDDPMD